MSKEGIKLFSNVLDIMQNSKINLLKGDNIDIRLGQILEEMKEFRKDEFCKLTMK